MSHSDYPASAAPARVLREYPLGEALQRRYGQRDAATMRALAALRARRFKRVLERAWQIPFYQRLWRDAGLQPGDIRGLRDIHKLPTYTKSDLLDSVERAPPFGDFHGAGASDLATRDARVFMHTTSGTTGTPQPLFFGVRDREIQNALLARAYIAQGLSPADVALSVYGFGMVNGGHYVREAVTRYTDALLLPAGTGLETPSAQVIEMLRRYGVTALLGFGDYLLRLGLLAEEAGLAGSPATGEGHKVRLLSGHIDHGLRDRLSALWGGAQVYDWYGVGDTGVIAAETPARDGLYLYEDAHHVDIVDPQSGAPLPIGEKGNLCVTVLFKDTVYPIIRFDTQDVSEIMPGDGTSLPALRRIRGFLGRSDNMVKLRGINVYPTAIAALLGNDDSLSGEYLCRLRRRNERDEMQVDIEWQGEDAQADARTRQLAALLRERLGVEVAVVLVAHGATAPDTQVDRRQKPLRLLDER